MNERNGMDPSTLPSRRPSRRELRKVADVDWAREQAKAHHLRYRSEHTEEGRPADALVQLAPGILGRVETMPDGTMLYSMGMAERPGHGDLGRFLDSLALDLRLVAIGVSSPIVAGMLERRGFRERTLTLYSIPGIPCLIRGPSAEAVDDIVYAVTEYSAQQLRKTRRASSLGLIDVG